ncbi:uncharacterized protein LOC114353926 isoform X2 [Ostrinia furnacalis]|uniref:uncharacterized protein LOC114353926 isoform X1 n=1 Tax=Ostrinia furnacalis TaxID=93504 RepID=UPI00103C830B|nr:uncharacterized protein LOC114353926 isoform X1 [Ostrinia furnacalis]XP_028161912.1 uncharacterized protein LOC114353926 isoform X2 [Ostrinia furnacalis]
MACNKAVYSIFIVIFGFICFIVGAVAVGLPNWGYFFSYDSNLQISMQSYYLENPSFEQGYFGPWIMCKKMFYNREKCGPDVSKFRPSAAVHIAGVVGAIGVSVLGVYCILSVLQLAMISSKERVGFKYTHLMMMKLALALLAALLSIAAAGLFAVQGDDGGYYLKRGEAFYVQIVCIVINSLLFIMSLYDVLFSRREGGDPTNPTGETHSTTINNPGFKEGRGISMTDASGKPYSSNGHGSVGSVNTTATTLTGLSDASTITRSPLRSSLKKPRPREGEPGLGIHNPGYSGHSPPLNRNGSQKKVRIQTHSTEV